MSPKERIAATYNFSEHPAIVAGISSAVFCGLQWFMNSDLFEAAEPKLVPFFYLFCVFFALLTLGQLLRLAHPVYFTPEGLEFCRLGKVYATLSWDQISAAGIRNRDRTSMSRGKWHLELTTVCYPKFHILNAAVTGLIQKAFFDIIRLDPTKHNIAQVKRFYGELDYEAK